MYGIPKIQFTEFKKGNKLKSSNEDTLVPLEREKKAITSEDGGTGKRKWMGMVGREGNLIWFWVRKKD